MDKWFAHLFKKVPFKNHKTVIAELKNPVSLRGFVARVTHLVCMGYNSDTNGNSNDQSKNPVAALQRSGNARFCKARLEHVFCKLSGFKVKERRILGDNLTKSKIVP